MINLSKLSLLMGIIFLTSLALQAQEFEFKVLGSKGKTLVDGKPLKVGAFIAPGQQIEVGEGAYLGLVHHSSKTIEISNPGTYKVSELTARVNGGANPLVNKYVNFIIDELTNSDEEANRYRRNVKTGSVTRRLNLGKANVRIFPMLPEPSSFVKTNEMITVKWYVEEGKPQPAEFIVSFENTFGDDLLQVTTKNSWIEVNMADPRLKSEQNVKVVIQAKEGQDIYEGEHMLKKLSKTKSEELDKGLMGFVDDGSALSKLILARYYEDNNLFANAIHAYEQAIKISEVDQYETLYIRFLEENGFTQAARKKIETASN